MFLAPPGANFKRAAFTLLELLAVLAIISVLMAIVIGVGRRAADSGKAARAKAELAVLAVALEAYKATCGDYPQTDDAARLLQSLLGRRGPLNTPLSVRSWLETARFTTAESRDPFADPSAILIDPWDQAYRYAYKTQAPWSSSSYVLYSAGPDRHDSASLLPGGFPDASAAANADNLYANR